MYQPGRVLSLAGRPALSTRRCRRGECLSHLTIFKKSPFGDGDECSDAIGYPIGSPSSTVRADSGYETFTFTSDQYMAITIYSTILTVDRFNCDRCICKTRGPFIKLYLNI